MDTEPSPIQNTPKSDISQEFKKMSQYWTTTALAQANSPTAMFPVLLA